MACDGRGAKLARIKGHRCCPCCQADNASLFDCEICGVWFSVCCDVLEALDKRRLPYSYINCNDEKVTANV